MVKEGKKYIVKIDDYDSEGNGVSHIDGFTVFVPNALVHEIVEIIIDKVNKSYGRGRVLEVLSLSNERVNPICSVYDKCGGCSLQHMSYKEQINFKKNKIINSLDKIGGVKNLSLDKFYSMSIPYEYRNKVQVPFSMNDSIISAGFYEKDTHNVINMDFCHIQFKEGNDIINLTKEYLKDNKIKPYNERLHHKGAKDYGLFRHILIRKGYNTNEIMVAIVLTYEDEEFLKEYKEILLDRFKNIKTIVLNINNEKTNRILGDFEKVLYGEGYIEDKINDFRFKVHSKSFFQVNTKQCEKLYSAAIDMCELKYGDTLLDAYSGIGTIGIVSSRKVKMVYGIEEVRESVICANENKRINNIKNIEFIHGKVEDEIDTLINKGVNITSAIIDPPRKGVKESVLKKLFDIKCKKIVYISCDASTLGRDTKILTSLGYKVLKVRGVDMFPQTHHVESIVSFRL